MKFEEIKPYVRYARFLKTIQEREYPKSIPCDCRLFFVDDGVGEIEIEEEKIKIKKGDVLLIKNGIRYHFLNFEVTYFALNFDYSFDNAYKNIPIPPVSFFEKENYEPVENVNFTDIIELNKYIYVEKMFNIKNLLYKIHSEYIKKLPYSEMTQSALLIAVLSEIIRNFKNFSSDVKNIKFEEIVSYLHLHYNENITNIELSKIFHFHPNYINEIFKKKLGMPLHQYVLGIRISNAISMLESSDMSICEISKITGFYDSSYFSRYFKKVTGVSPKNYR